MSKILKYTKQQLMDMRTALSVIGQKDNNDAALDCAKNYAKINATLSETDVVIDQLRQKACQKNPMGGSYMTTKDGADFLYVSTEVEAEYKKTFSELMNESVDVSIIEIPEEKLKNISVPANALFFLMERGLLVPEVAKVSGV